MNDVKTYIDTELDLSNSYISQLLKLKNIKGSKKRILEIEKEFVSLPWHDMSFESKSDVATAMSIYRDSRSLFYKLYNINNLVSKKTYNSSLVIYNKKLNFLELKIKKLDKLSKSKSNIENFEKFCNDKNLSSLKKKKLKAKVLVILRSIFKYLKNKRSSILEPSSIEDIIKNKVYIDKSIEGIRQNIFKEYNSSIIELAEVSDKNLYFNKMHSLEHLKLDFNIFFKSKNNELISEGQLCSLRNRKIKQISNYGFVTGLRRIGNENLSCLYRNIIIDGKDFSRFFDYNFSNVIVEDKEGRQYYKSLMLHSEKDKLSKEERDVFSKYILNSDKKYISKNSLILFAKTRSEEEGIRLALEYLKEYINKIKEDYYSIFYTTNENSY